MNDKQWLEEFLQLMSEYRKAVFEFAQTPMGSAYFDENHDRMTSAQRALFEHAKLKA